MHGPLNVKKKYQFKILNYMMFWKPGYYSRCSLGHGLDGPGFGYPKLVLSA